MMISPERKKKSIGFIYIYRIVSGYIYIYISICAGILGYYIMQSWIKIWVFENFIFLYSFLEFLFHSFTRDLCID